MNNGIKNLLSFIAGAAIASAVTWKVASKIYEEEIESVKEVFSQRKQKGNDEVETSISKRHKEELNDIIKENGYTSDSDKKEEKGGSEKVMNTYENIHIVSPNEFGEDDNYDVTSLTYYADGVITDEMDNVIDNPEELVGADIASHFGDFEEDSVFIRNDDTETYYEVLMDCQNYSDVANPNLED